MSRLLPLMRQGDLEGARSVLEQGVETPTTYSAIYNTTPIYQAVVNQDTPFFRLFVGSDSFDPSDPWASSALAVALRFNNYEMIRDLVRKGTLLRIKPGDRVSGPELLDRLIQNRNVRVLEILLPALDREGLTEEYGQRWGRLAIESGDTSTIKSLYRHLLDNDAVIDATTGDTPFSYAVRRGYTDVVRWMLLHGFDPNRQVGPLRLSPIQIAIRTGQVEMVRLLVDDPLVDLNQRDLEGDNAKTDSERDPEMEEIVWRDYIYYDHRPNPEYRELLEETRSTVYYDRVEELVHLYRYLSENGRIAPDDVPMWRLWFEQIDRDVREQRLTPETLDRIYDRIKELYRIDLYTPCINIDNDFITFESFVSEPKNKYIVLVLPDGGRYCVGIEPLLEYFEGQKPMANWVQNPRASQPIDDQGYGGMAGRRRYFKLPLDRNAWIEDNDIDTIKFRLRQVKDGPVLSRPVTFYLTGEERIRLGDPSSRFIVSGLHGQLPLETVYTMIYEETD